MYRYMDGQMDRQIERQIERQIDKQKERYSKDKEKAGGGSTAKSASRLIPRGLKILEEDMPLERARDRHQVTSPSITDSHKRERQQVTKERERETTGYEPFDLELLEGPETTMPSKIEADTQQVPGKIETATQQLLKKSRQL